MRLALAVGVCCLVSFLPHARAQDAEAGEQVFKSQCSICHGVDSRNRVGPGLHGLFGRVSGTVPGYAYSTANNEKHITWSAETLDPYLKSPRQVVPGTKMTYAGLADDKRRADLIAYLERATKPTDDVAAPAK